MGYASMKNFFDSLYLTEPQSLTLTREVLTERERLEVLVDSYKTLLREEAAKASALIEISEKLQEHEEEIQRNKKYEIEKVTSYKPLTFTGKKFSVFKYVWEVCHQLQ